VLADYESAFSDSGRTSSENGSGNSAARFVSWDIVKPKREQMHVLETLGPLTVRFVVEINRSVRSGHHGVHLFNQDGLMIWGAAVENLRLEPGLHEFTCEISTLPVKPGPYYWMVSLWDGGQELDLWNCVPALQINTLPMAHPQDEWAGLLNMPCRFEAHASSQREAAATIK
jgi:hypothetical protein